MIDIIIPCYNSHETIDRTLASILVQRVSPSITVTLVNDAGKGYTDVINRWKDVLNIREIGYEDNGGPAKARNFGLKNTKEPLVMFMDSDDVLADTFSVILLTNAICKDEHTVIAISKFTEEVAPMQVKLHEKDTSFMHGKIYKRAFLEKYNILQNENTRCNEDVGFNILALLLAKNLGYTINIIDNNTYYWLYNEKSLVRSNKDIYDNSVAFQGFVENMYYVYSELEKRGVDTPNIFMEKVTTMIRLYFLFLERSKYPQFIKDNKTVLTKFYKKIYKPIEDKITEQIFEDAFQAITHVPHDKATRKALKKFLREL